MSRSLTLAAFVFALGAASPAIAQTSGQQVPGTPGVSKAFHKMDPKLGLLEHVMQTQGADAALFGPDGAPSSVREDGVVASVRTGSQLTPAQIGAFEQAGVTFRRDNSRVARFGTTYTAFVEWRAIDFLAGHADVQRVEAEWYPTETRPLEVTSEMVGAAQAHKVPDVGVDGEGALVADIDSGIDVLHPHFFKADGGSYAWVDVDEDGSFTKGIDAIDMNRDGTLGGDETLRVLDATVLSRNFQDKENDDGEFQPRRDWLYIDTDVDQERNVGTSAGFGESDPAYGEPIFVADDVNRNGMLDVGERLVRLKTSKIKKFVVGDETYVRGQNLIQGADIQEPQPFHGTGVASIVVGGQARYHDRVGLAPGAELIMYAMSSERGQQQERDFSSRIGYIEDAVDSGADMILHEWTDLVSMPPDGSSNLEGAMDTARVQGMMQVNPLGNMNLSGKHIERELIPGETLEFKFEVGDGVNYGGQQYPYSVAYGGLFWTSDDDLTVTYISPNGEEFQADQSEGETTIGDDSFYTSFQVTPRNTRHMAFYAYRDDFQTSIAKGEWTIRIEGVEKEGKIVGRVADYFSGWSQGIKWTDPTEGSGTLVFPSTADSAIGVAAFGGRHEGGSFGGGGPWELRGYSGRGPRIDGARGVDIAAPDDPYAALSYTEQYGEYGVGRSWLMTFGGTSGAGPHVAAALALLIEQNPDWTPDQLEERLTSTAVGDELEPDFGETPNPHWGFGQVDVFNALYGEPRPTETNQTPIAALDVATNGPDLTLDASESSDPDGDELEYRFDFEYDGEFDTEWLESSEVAGTVDAEPGVSIVSRVEVRDPSGFRSGKLVDTLVSLPSEEETDTGTSPDAGGVDAGSDDVGAPNASVSDGNGGCSGCTTRGDQLPVGWIMIVAAVGLGGMISRRRKAA